MYHTIPSRGLEAVREGIQEYKRLHELKRLGVDERLLDGFADRVLDPGRAFQAKSITVLDDVRQEMDELLLEHAGVN